VNTSFLFYTKHVIQDKMHDYLENSSRFARTVWSYE